MIKINKPAAYLFSRRGCPFRISRGTMFGPGCRHPKHEGHTAFCKDGKYPNTDEGFPDDCPFEPGQTYSIEQTFSRY